MPIKPTKLKTTKQIDRQDQLKKMLEEFSKLNPETLGKKSTRGRKPLETIKIGNLYSFHETSAKDSYHKLSSVYFEQISNLKEYYEIAANGDEYYNENEDEEHGYFKKDTTCLVCDIVVRNAKYSSLHKKILNSPVDDDDIIIMVDNRFYLVSHEMFANFAKELSGNKTK